MRDAWFANRDALLAFWDLPDGHAPWAARRFEAES
jgi:hypothetical protein